MNRKNINIPQYKESRVYLRKMGILSRLAVIMASLMLLLTGCKGSGEEEKTERKKEDTDNIVSGIISEETSSLGIDCTGRDYDNNKYRQDGFLYIG